MHGYELRRELEDELGPEWTVNYGQIYSTLERLVRDGLVVRSARVSTADAPDRKLYTVTPAGRTHLREWFLTPLDGADGGRDELYAKVLLALTGDVDLEQVFQVERKGRLRRIGRLTALKEQLDPGIHLAAVLELDLSIRKTGAVIRWLDTAESKIRKTASMQPDGVSGGGGASARDGGRAAQGPVGKGDSGMNVLRDIFRRKARSVLTISGIGIGVFALVVLGAVAENQNVYADRLLGYYRKAIVVVEENNANVFGMSNGNRPLSMEAIEQLRDHPGVEDVSPQVNLLLEGDHMSVIPPMVLGTEPGKGDYDQFSVSEGRAVEMNERRVAIVGSDLAKQKKLEVGDTMEVRGERYSVVGLLDRTYVNLLDSAVYVPLADAQRMYVASLPKAFQSTVRPDDLVLQANVYAKPGVDPDALADELERDVAEIHASGPAEMMKTVDGLVTLINAVVASIAALALLICGLSIMNTMTMAVGERTREIGVKRALGASRRRIALDVLAESALMGALGGMGGLAAGAPAATALNSAMVAATGTTSFLLTWRLAAAALVFAVVLGTLGGLYPARHASQMDPAAALAFE